MQAEIRHAVAVQEQIGLDVLVHGEAERNDMVEYFAEQLEGYVFTRFGWVQSYGSRCVKPAIIYGDLSRPRPMTVDWIRYAQQHGQDHERHAHRSGDHADVVVRPRGRAARGAGATVGAGHSRRGLRPEAAGIRIIQIDEAAFREACRCAASSGGTTWTGRWRRSACAPAGARRDADPRICATANSTT